MYAISAHRARSDRIQIVLERVPPAYAIALATRPSTERSQRTDHAHHTIAIAVDSCDRDRYAIDMRAEHRQVTRARSPRDRDRYASELRGAPRWITRD